MCWSRLLAERGGESEYFSFICWFQIFSLSLSLAQTLSQNGRVHCNLFFRRVKHKISFWHQAQETLTLLYQIVQDWYFHHVNWKLKIFKNFLLRDDLCSWWLCSWRMEMGNELSLPFVVYNIVLVFRVRQCTMDGHVKLDGELPQMFKLWDPLQDFLWHSITSITWSFLRCHKLF